MKICEVSKKTPKLLKSLVNVWESSVACTHDFLSSEEIAKIKSIVPKALLEVEHLVVAQEGDLPIGFVGVENEKIEMLFVSADKRGCGVGRKLVAYAVDNFAANVVTVNEQNPQAIGFYERLGFETFLRTDVDEHGNPYPLLYMRLKR